MKIAIVTGASSGIGASYVCQLAEKYSWLVLCIGFVVSRKITVVQWFSGLTASITSLSALLSVVLVMGFVGPGIERITMSWPFVLLFLYFLFVLGFVTLKRIVSFRWRDVPFC